MKYFLIFILFFTCLTFTSQAQSKKKSKEKRTEQAERDNSYAPFSPAESAVDAGQRTEAKSSGKTKAKKESYYQIFNRRMDQKMVEFQKRMKENAKEDRKEARLMKKPQYSDPMYFGHKKKPKKRPPGKRKFCKECGIVH